MKDKFRGLRWVTVAALVVPLLALLPATAANAVSGAVSTTDNPGWSDTYDGYVNQACLNGQGVNCNIYLEKQDVWLSGLPVSASLGEGTYFFAVLSPGGQPNPNDCAPLKANGDPANLSDTAPCETTNTGAGDTWQNRTFSVDSSGNITYPVISGGHDFDSTNNEIQLFPYDNTPNPGGVYILAVCAVPDGATAPPGGPGVKPSDCKYDAFKVTGGNTAPEAVAPTIVKDAAGTNDRECEWTLSKAVTPTTITQTSGSPAATFNYTVTLSATCTKIENVKVTGTIDVFNPNIGDITGAYVTDTLSDGTICAVDGSAAVDGGVAATLTGVGSGSGDNFFTYECGLTALPQGQLNNTATVTWDEQTLDPDGHLAGGSASFTFTDIAFTETLTDDCATVSDTNPAGPQAVEECVDASGGTFTFTYSVTFDPPALGTCVTHDNTASFEDNSTPQNKDSVTKTVTVCNYGPRFTPGYWKNHLANSAKTGPYTDTLCKSGLPSGTSCSSNGPWAKQWANSSQWKCLGGADNCSGVTTNPGYTGYKVDTILKAANVFYVMNCSNTGSTTSSSNTQRNNALGCLAGHLLAAKYNRNINLSNPCIDATITAADALLASLLYHGPGTYTLTQAQRNQAITLKTALDAYDNGGGCV